LTDKQMTFKYFKLEEFACKHTGKNAIEEEFVHRLDALREECGFPFTITSGYRHHTHPVESRKSTIGTHCRGIAADIAVGNGIERATLVANAFKLGFTGIGVAKGFIHVDIRESDSVLWVY